LPYFAIVESPWPCETPVQCLAPRPSLAAHSPSQLSCETQARTISKALIYL